MSNKEGRSLYLYKQPVIKLSWLAIPVRKPRGPQQSPPNDSIVSQFQNIHLHKGDYFVILPSCLHSIITLTRTLQMDWWDSGFCLGKKCKIYSECLWCTMMHLKIWKFLIVRSLTILKKCTNYLSVWCWITFFSFNQS